MAVAVPFARLVAMGFQADVTLNILDSLRDNFGLVAGDGIDDAWQFEFFDIDDNDILDPNEAANAAPGADPDSDSSSNFFEWATGFHPLNVGRLGSGLRLPGRTPGLAAGAGSH